MSPLPTSADVLDEIEFELMQEAVSRDDLSRSVQAIRQFQNKVRAEVFQSDERVTNRLTISKLFQLNDMLITILQEMAASQQALQRDMRRESKWAPRQEPPVSPGVQTQWHMLSNERETTEIEKAMRAETIQVDMQARLTHLPIVGRFIGALQIFWHRPALFYVRLLADRQADVNRILGDWILYLNERDREQAAQWEQQVLAMQTRMIETSQPKDQSA